MGVVDMQAEFVNPIIEAVVYVISTSLKMEAKVGQVFVRTAPSNCGGVGICLGITGKLRGQVVFSMQNSLACKIASKMMREEIEELDEVSRSAVTELANMIMGRTAATLFNNGVKIDITPPAFLLGENLIYLGTNKVKTLCVPFILEDGSLIEAEIFVARDE